jgi:hypothetical protein
MSRGSLHAGKSSCRHRLLRSSATSDRVSIVFLSKPNLFGPAQSPACRRLAGADAVLPSRFSQK